MQRELEAVDRLSWKTFGGVSERVLTSGAPAVLTAVGIERAARNQGAWLLSFVRRASVHSGAVVAMRVSGASIGVLAVARQSDSRPICDDDVQYIQSVADRLALAVENLRLKDEVERLGNSDRGRLPDARLAGLSQRELEVLALIGQGLTNREIGERLFLSIRTIEWYRARLVSKLDVHERSALIALGRTLSS